MNPNKSAAIILAAGESRRMGQTKQLLVLKGKTLLETAIDKTLSLGIPVVLVLGARSEQIKSEIDTRQVTISINHDWEKGISSSIRCGIRSALELVPDVSGVLMVLADQPGITVDHLRSLFEQGTFKDRIVATEYRGALGVPAYFPGENFEQLLKLSGDQGAKPLLQKSRQSVVPVPFEPAALDIDTRQDWINFLQGNPDIDNSVN
jgi:molybdenum cofactor cytidylyltransferase